MYRSVVLPAIIFLAFSSGLSAAPNIDFDTRNFKCDTVLEDTNEKLKAVFRVKNTGDSVLKITNVRPGCGCTVVKFDSIVKPGKTASINAEVNIKGYRAGDFTKYITVSSNAANEKDVRLGISATIVAIIGLSDYNINFDGNDRAQTRTVTLTSKKHDLSVTEVGLKPSGSGAGTEWQSEVRIPFTFSWKPLDSIRADGARVFRLELTPPAVTSPVSGDIVIKTNHPDRPELRIQTFIASR